MDHERLAREGADRSLTRQETKQCFFEDYRYCLISAPAFADTQTTVREQAQMKEKAARWFKIFL